MTYVVCVAGFDCLSALRCVPSASDCFATWFGYWDNNKHVTPTDARSGVTFDVELEVPWNAPEAYIQLDSDSVYDLATVPDVFSLCDRRPAVHFVASG